MKIIDITKEMLSAEIYPGDTAPSLNRANTVEKGGYNVSDLACCLHNGTHIDAPLHVKTGGAGAAEIPIEKCFGKCLVISVNGKLGLRAFSEIKRSGIKRVILKNAEITAVSAFMLSLLKLDLLGTEKQSAGNLSVHRSLLSAGTVILEGLDLSAAEDGEYTLCALPLKIAGADGTPVRAVLIRGE